MRLPLRASCLLLLSFASIAGASPAIAQPSHPASPNGVAGGSERAADRASERVMDRPSSSGSRMEYALYVGEGLDGQRLFATATSETRGRNWRQFAERLQAQAFPGYPRTEPAFFTWLGERGWELVQCAQREEVVGLLGDRDVVTRCYFRRAAGGTVEPTTRDTLANPAAPAGPSR